MHTVVYHTMGVWVPEVHFVDSFSLICLGSGFLVSPSFCSFVPPPPRSIDVDVRCPFIQQCSLDASNLSHPHLSSFRLCLVSIFDNCNRDRRQWPDGHEPRCRLRGSAISTTPPHRRPAPQTHAPCDFRHLSHQLFPMRQRPSHRLLLPGWRLLHIPRKQHDRVMLPCRRGLLADRTVDLQHSRPECHSLSNSLSSHDEPDGRAADLRVTMLPFWICLQYE